MTSDDINKAIGYLKLTPGNYVFDKPITPRSDTIVDATGCNIMGPILGPAIHLLNYQSGVVGGVWNMPSDNNSPVASIMNCTCTRLDNLRLNGNKEQSTIAGLCVVGNQPTYFLSSVNIRIGNCINGIILRTNANACNITNLYMERITSVGLWIDGGLENYVQGFHHGGGGAKPSEFGIRLSNQARYNQLFYRAEPGTKSSPTKPYGIDEGCNGNQLFCQLNCAGGTYNRGQDNVILRFTNIWDTPVRLNDR